ncbi:MAG: O-antigen ligase family protein [Aquisalimonadaceae bacterium]
MPDALIKFRLGWPLYLWLLAAVLLASLDLYPRLSIYDQRRIVQVFLLGIFSIYLLAQPERRSSSLPTVTAILLFIIVGLGSISSALAVVPTYAYLEVSLLVLMVAAIHVIGNSTDKHDLIRTPTLPILAIGACLYGLVALMILTAGWAYEGEPVWPEPIHNFVNIRFLNQWQSWMLPLLPALLFAGIPRCRPWLLRSCLLLYFGLLWALLFYSAGRGTLYAITCATALVILFFGRAGLRWGVLQIAMATTGLVLAALIFGMDLPFASGESSRGTRVMSFQSPGRVVLWTVSADLIRESPWFGIGPMQFATLQLPIAAHPHNLPIQIAVEWGIPAALILSGLLLWLLFRWLRFARHRVRSTDCPAWERYFIISLTCSLLTAGGHSLLSGIVVMPMSQIMLVLTCGLAVGWYRRYNTTDPVAENPTILGMWRITLLGSAIWLWGFGGLELSNHRYNDEIGVVAANGHYQPRFWRQGKLIHLMDSPPRRFDIDNTRNQ